MLYHNLSCSVGDLASMETLRVETPAPDDGSGANPSSVKSDDSSTPHESGRGSPPPNCAICLGTCRNKCFTDSCLHQFCFKCLLTWSKVKAECPLCKQNFRSIIHNVRSNHQYEEYLVEQRQTEGSPEQAGLDNFTSATRRFRYRTTLTLPRHETIAIQQLLMHYPMVAGVFPHSRVPPARRRRRSPASFRRTVYRHNLWARPLPDFTGRFRDCSPEFYRYNDSQMHRLVPWLTRELHYLLNENVGHISYVLARILELLKQYHINSAEFTEAMQRYFGERTEHFLHELHCFASTPYDMTGYDRNVQYTTDTRISTIVNEVLSSSDSEASVDSDIVMVSSSGPAEPPPGPSRLPVPVYPQHYIPPPAAPAGGVVPIETISHSGSDDDDEVMVVGYIKPPQDRTPEVVDLLGSDSDVIVQDSAPPEPAPATASASASAPAPAPLVKLSLKRARRSAGSDSDSSYCPPTPPRPRRRRRRSALSASPAFTASPASTASTAPSRSPSRDRAPPDPAVPSPSPTTTTATTATTTTTTTTTTITTTTDTDTDIVSSDDHRRRTPKNTRRKSTKQHAEKDKKKSKKSTSRSHKNRKPKEPPAESTKRSKRKSHSGKGVKSSKRSESDSAPLERGAEAAAASKAGPSTSSADRDRRRRRPSRDNKRLKSVVNVMTQKNSSDSSSSGNSNLLNILSSAILKPNSSVLAYNSDSGSTAGSERRGGAGGAARALLQRADACLALRPASPSRAEPASPARSAASDSDDDLPLNLSVHKTYTKL